MGVRKGGLQPRRKIVTATGEGIPPMYLSLVGELKAARIAKGLGTRDVADALGVSVKTIWAWENPGSRGKESPSSTHAFDLCRWAEFLDVKLSAR